MPNRSRHRQTSDPTPAERLTRAINDIDNGLKSVRLHDQPVPLNAYRARRILMKALARCCGRTGTPLSGP